MATLPEVNLGGHKAVAITAGGPGNLDRGDTCVILDDGSVRCWGDDQYGQLGHDGTDEIHGGTATNSIVAHGAVPLPQKAVAISTGGNHTCVILADRTVRCWGDGEYGQLGNDSTKRRGRRRRGRHDDGEPHGGPARPGGHGDQRRRAAHLRGPADASLKCWGYNGAGQLGHDSTVNYGTGRRRCPRWPPRTSAATRRSRSAPGGCTRARCWTTARCAAGGSAGSAASATTRR